ncbi:cb79ad8b-ce1a-4679-8f56-029cf405b5ce [Thermothielavioides terrestris]|uniref:Cb79ad8b-ce1a-4679-8f56-029cf405b5ce n=1 Tax=Thermothielavioides terrestris TaxID=2587410 RepID=A0A446BPX2_9PEZI|nr:cb79ad8b-ce1a-4679-8f56-029cf405b5ce [Thermothielavioides terrestris]
MAGGNTQQVKFVGHDAAGLPVKRKQVNQACLPCRKRKHVPDAYVPAALATEKDHDRGQAVSRAAPAAPSGARERGRGDVPDRDTSDAAAQLLRFFHHASDKAPADTPNTDQTEQPRQMSPAPPFLGDLNPESILVEATMATAPGPKTPQTENQPDHQRIGFLPPTSPHESRPPAARDRSTGSPKLVDDIPGPFFSVPKEDGTRFTIHVQDTAKFATLAQTLANRALADKVMPSDAEWKALRDIYLAKIHPIFPIYDESTLLVLPEEPTLRGLIQASVCLAAATDPEAGRFLTFKNHVLGASPSQTVVPYDEYSRGVAELINKRLAELQESRRISLVQQIQVMALTCLYWQPANPTERFEPMSLYARLVALVHTHGVHLDVLARTQACRPQNRQRSGSRLFKCLYALDRLVGAIGGRPFMFHNYDLMRVPRPEADDPPIFRLFIALILLLDQVVELYRPSPKISYVDIPVFEHMVIDAGAEGEPDSLLATLEVLYHAIGVLSVRMPRDRFRTAPECDTLPGPRTEHLPPSSVNARRSHGADRILDVTRDYRLSPMPFIPYALALSLGVAYRKWRFSRLPMFRTRGGADFKKVLPVLQDMGAIWSSARLNGQLGQAVVLKLDRNEIMGRKRVQKTTGTARPGRGPVAVVRQDADSHQDVPTDGPDRTGAEHEAQPTNSPNSTSRAASTLPEGSSSTTPPAAASNAGVPLEPPQAHQPERTNVSNPKAPPLTPHGSLPSPATSSLPDQPHSLPLSWTTPSNNDPNHTNAPTSSPWPAPTRTAPPRHNPPDHQPPPPATAAYEYPQLDDAIPLPADMLPQPSGGSGGGSAHGETAPTEKPTERGGSLDDFLADGDGDGDDDDDALFRAWDPRFAQSVDFSFSSILDPGNPFAWPEYCSYLS